ncbi:MAG: trigger factor [Clostridia bacterium]|nr:trigger factor [Clostridia bacterium]
MSLIKKEQKEDKRWELTFSVSRATFEAAVDEVAKKKLPNFNIPGFRKGKAPRAIVEKMYGKGIFFEDAVNEVLPDAYEAAVKEAELDVVGRPEFDVLSLEGDPTMSAVVYVKPEVKVEGYLGIEAEKKAQEVKDEDVEAEVRRMQERNARTVDVTDRPAENDDTVTIDYVGTIDGVAFEGGSAKEHPLKLGSGSFIPGFEEQIVGHSVGDEFDVTVTFPADYHAKELAGKEAVFAVKVHKITKSELPEADDEFAKDISEFDTMDAYKADVRAKLAEKNEKAAENAFESALCDALIEKLEAEIPEPMFAAETDNQVRDYDSRLRMQGLDLSTYFKYTGLTIDALRAQLRPQAEKQVKLRLALEYISNKEEVSVSDEEIEAEYQRISDAYNVPIERVKEMVSHDDIKADLAVKAAMDLVKEKAVVKA